MVKWAYCLQLGCVGVFYVLASTQATVSDETTYKSPVPAGKVYFAENFDIEQDFRQRWVSSKAKKDGQEFAYDGKFEIGHSEDKNRLHGDFGLVLKTKASHHAISAALKQPFLFDFLPIVIQYEVQFMNGMECGGAYLKLLSQPTDGKSTPDLLASLNDKTPYSIMFGPDKCGLQQKLHFIIQHKNPITGQLEEKHWKDAVNAGKAMNGKFGDVFTDKRPHLYTLVLNRDSTFEISIDGRLEVQGSLSNDMDPPIYPPKEIEDKDDVKPADWDEREKISDPEAVKPEDWDDTQPAEIPDPKAEKPIGWLDDEPLLVPDPEAKQPNDWDEDMDGTWEAPLVDNPKCKEVGCGKWEPPVIANPKYKGVWHPPMIDNPAYKGKWRPRKIPNPDYFFDERPFNSIPTAVAVGFELWSMTDGILFDNLIITDDRTVATQYAEDSFKLKIRNLDKDNKSFFDETMASFVDYSTQYPWLWGIYVLAVGIPAALIISYCCMSKSNRDEELIRRKKSDLEGDEALLPESEKAEEDQPNVAGGDVADDIADGVEDDAAEDEADQHEESPGGSGSPGSASAVSVAADQSDEEGVKESEETGGTGKQTGTRQRRKARKD
ncbi:calnexin-like isoform X2 [Varroa jacobsoni]|nr:calnexin-like isoform X2 [Varroa destructor]XP_022647359.1 calnexin-like isoform X2 [Varroa destructor]XP_022647360.1 calnexin-like isoform X2 [Varroa destructor]XP_022647361.1 calnexin-like isoform X2 [Varroa destructor]XP_022647362.1 calnexin-like isoform X2 [Varroa destructor]XP_022692105.1 calnexin-like isoform X2 [Varroa jacobsoni]XP_022692106.1 calnexin-like isoform X2 [Varroa jacobsoni]XP_022692107.1 calnexin-like isoform X2 [Varroa jacobsoni]XP_022692108.1 calnexin-like isoform X